MRVRWFFAGFGACYLLASFCTGAVLYASQKVGFYEAAMIGPRWPVTAAIIAQPDAWLRNRP